MPVTFTVTPGSGTGTQAAAKKQVRGAGFVWASQEDWWTIAGLSLLTVFFLLGMSKPRKRLKGAFLAGVVCAVSLAMGCGGGGGSTGGGGAGGNQSVASTTALTLSAAKVPLGTPFTMTAKVTSSKTPTGFVTFYQGTTPISPQEPLVAGTASYTLDFTMLPGIYAISAQYSGDTSNLASQSGASTEVITGETLVNIAGQTGTLVHNTVLAIELQ